MKIKEQRAKSGKISIYTDGEYRFSVPETVWYLSGKSDGDEIDEEELLSLKREGDSSFAFESALRILSLRANSRKELYMKLCTKYSAEAAQSALEHCDSAGLTDDFKFAEGYARELNERKNFSVNRIQAELARKGISRDIISDVVNSLDYDKNQGIINTLNKMHLSYPLSEKDKNRAIRRLLSLGYSLSDIRKHISFTEE